MIMCKPYQNWDWWSESPKKASRRIDKKVRAATGLDNWLTLVHPLVLD
jgi:hypothetical protein